MDWIRALRIGFRTAHLLAFGVLYGGHVYGVADERLVGAWIAVVGTGMALLLVDAARQPVSLIQVRGLASAVKITLAAGSAALPEHRVALLTIVAMIGAVSSHMPGRLRYYSPFHGREVGAREKG